ncbi:MAG: tetratricopeptide repeat protein, partial [Methanoregulaceae archaeon]|nr:tetratricopeptide repeat protein [Methanoregulaceae archaeon]
PDYARFDAKLWANKGEALFRLGRYPEAVEAYSTALAINPKYDRAFQGKIHAEEEILRARGSPTITIPAKEENGINIGVTNLSGSVPTLVGSLLAAVLLVWIGRQKK